MGSSKQTIIPLPKGWDVVMAEIYYSCVIVLHPLNFTLNSYSATNKEMKFVTLSSAMVSWTRFGFSFGQKFHVEFEIFVNKL